MLETSLKKYFNFSQFRAGQKEIAESILAGKDVVALMPTGGGKSLCFQLPAILSEGVSIVISPLIALMQDQVDGLMARGISATYINSSLSFEEISQRLFDIKNGKIKIVYIAPERFGNRQFQKMFAELEVFLLAVDEAHCVSQWGHDFRPDYLNVRKYIDLLKKRPIVAAFTATATPEVKDDIIERLDLRNPIVFVRGFDRPNLKFFVRENLKKKERASEALRIAKSIKGSGIVYAITRKETEELAKFFKAQGVGAVAYHAGMTGAEREKIQNDFMENRFKVIVATIAFGMGVDKADIRFVIHAGMPSSPEGYYQEAGRAGRDGQQAFCILLHSKSDASLHNFFILTSKGEMRLQGKSWEESQKIVGVKYAKLNKMKEYVGLGTCRRLLLLDYFGDPAVKNHSGNCGGCDVCLDYKWEKSDVVGNENPKKAFKWKRQRQQGEIFGTVLETVELYRQNYAPDAIAKIRSLGTSTVLGHLIEWYETGGDFRVEEFLNPETEILIFEAIEKVGNAERLGPLKKELPAEITYEQIKMALAKRRRSSN